MLGREGAHARRDGVQLVARQLREEVVLDLHLEAAVEPVRVPLAREVARGGELRLEEAERALLGRRELLCAQVRHQQLDVQHPHGAVVHQPEDKALARAREGEGHERRVPQPVRAHRQQIAAVAPLDRKGPRDADEVEAGDEEDERQKGDVLHARQQLDATPQELARARRHRQLGLPQRHLLERLQPDGEVEELRVGVRPQRVRVVLRVLLEPHLHRDAQQQARVELAELLAGARVAAPRANAVVHRVVRQEGRLLQPDAQQHGRQPEAHGVALAAREEAERASQKGEDEHLLERVVGGARLEGALLPQLPAQLAVLEGARVGRRRGRRGDVRGGARVMEQAMVQRRLHHDVAADCSVGVGVGVGGRSGRGGRARGVGAGAGGRVVGRVVDQAADEQGAEARRDRCAVEELELVGGVDAGVLDDDDAARVALVEGGHVVDAAVHGEPHVVDGAVAAHLGARDVARGPRRDGGHRHVERRRRGGLGGLGPR